ncbi:calpastatin isoform X3 [Ictalurus punctatus]|uniref:Calpastatin n=1 Tax=Ictalurus punctatus TaxID=7998 RepID=A0A2D0SZI8_ICTPU|nr:calpastatin isoform X3 [Ictalurus punctatus]
MGQLLSLLRGTQGPSAPEDTAVEQQSQPKQSTSTPSVPVSTVKPAQHEKGAASSTAAGAAAKPATTRASAATTTVGTQSTSTASSAAASSVTNVGATTGAKVSGGVTTTTGSSGASTTTGSSKATTQAPPVSSAKAPSVSAGTTGSIGGAGKPPTELVKLTDTSKVQEPSKVTSTVTKPTATTVVSGTPGQKDDVKSKEAKVKSEVSAKASTLVPAVDPFDSLADSLPSAKPSERPRFTGPEVTEPSITSAVAPRCGERDDTLPPGYRLKDMEKKMPIGQPEKPKEVSKSSTLDDAVDSLSAGFVSSTPPGASKPEVKHETVVAADTRKNYAPAPPAQKKQDVSVPASLSPAPPADKKPKTEKSAKDAVTAAAQDVKPKTEKEKKVSADKPKQDPKADPMSLEALDALGDTLPEAKPVPKPPKLRPDQIVDEKKLKSEKGVRVGERDDTLPPEYRFKEDKDKKPLPPPPKEPSMDTTEALDILSGDFTDATVAPAVHTPAPPKPQAKQPKVEDLSALDALAGDFVAPVQAKKVCSGVPPVPKPATKSTPPTSAQADPMSLDALDALGDTLPEAKPVPEPPKLRPEQIVDEAKLKSEKGVFVGERDDSLPPDYRFLKEDPKSQPPPPKKEPSLDPADALDILSGEFTSTSAAPVVQTSVCPSAPPAYSSEDVALDELAGDFVAPTRASKVCSAASAPTTTDTQADPMSLDALDALGGMLPDAEPVPESPKLRPEEIVDEAKLKSEKGVFVGEREDSLPPDYRFPKDDRKAKPLPPKKEPSMDPTEALDILSGDFTSSSVAPVVQTPVCPSAPPADSSADFALEELAGDFVAPMRASKVSSAASVPPTTERQLSEGTTSAMDALSDTLNDIRPVPEPEPVPPKHVVKEKEVVEERVSKPGERDDSLPPEYRPTEADIKAAAEAKAKAPTAPKQPSFDDSKALDILSGDFVSGSVTKPAAQCQAPPAKTSSSSQQESGPVLDKLAGTLLPADFPDTKQRDSKPKKPAVADVTAAEPLPAKPTTDVVSSSPTKKGRKS